MLFPEIARFPIASPDYPADFRAETILPSLCCSCSYVPPTHPLGKSRTARKESWSSLPRCPEYILHFCQRKQVYTLLSLIVISGKVINIIGSRICPSLLFHVDCSECFKVEISTKRFLFDSPRGGIFIKLSIRAWGFVRLFWFWVNDRMLSLIDKPLVFFSRPSRTQASFQFGHVFYRSRFCLFYAFGLLGVEIGILRKESSHECLSNDPMGIFLRL